MTPAYQVIHKTKPVNINCNSNGRKNWYKDGQRLSGAILRADNVLIERAFEEHIGDYICEGIIGNGKPFTATSTLLVGGKYYYLLYFFFQTPLAFNPCTNNQNQ